MTEKYDPLDNDETMMNLDDSNLSMGDMGTAEFPISNNDPQNADVSLGDMPTMAGGAGGTPAGRSDEGFEGKALSERYEDLVEIGRGGFAVVYKARDKRLRREVVVKRLHFEQTGMDDEIIRKRFEHEAHAIAALNHQNIVQVYDYDRDAEGHYIVMEYVSGGSLKDLLKQKGKLEVKEAVRIVQSVCEGLAFAHRKNLIHRDIKPANILMQGGVPKIADFGLARAGFETGMSMSLSMSGTGMGTPYYMPPEQREDAKNVNHTADIYAVGKTLYQLVTGDIPDSVDPELIPSPSLAKIIFKCVKSRPEDRYFSMEELVKALDSPKSNAQSLKPAGDNACPKCGRGCSDMEIFCAGCGEDLNKPCPECGQKNSMFRKFCNSCGVDVEVFLLAVKVSDQVSKLGKAKNWAGVVVAAEGLPKDMRLGKKGTDLKKHIEEAKKTAQTNLQEIARLERTFLECAGSTALLDGENEKRDPARALQSLGQVLENISGLEKLKPLSPEQEKLKKKTQEEINQFEAELQRRKDEEQRRKDEEQRRKAEEEKRKKQEAAEKSRVVRRKKRKALLVGVVIVAGLAGSVIVGGGIAEQQRKKKEQERIVAEQQKEQERIEANRTGKEKILDLGNSVEMEFVEVPAGSFQMGSNSGNSGEKPEHKVTLTKPFWMGKYEVTQAQYQQIMGSNPSNFKGSCLPVETVNWHDAMSFCKKLTERERQAGRLPAGFEYTLPTEAQWEYACRAGTTGYYARSLDAMGWHYKNSERKTHPVGEQQANAWGLYDMQGNVWEWCSDWYGGYASGSVTDPSGASRGSDRVFRGGSWSNHASLCQSAFRAGSAPSSAGSRHGFRAVVQGR